MSTVLPVGWGYAPQPKDEFDRARAEERARAEHMARQTAGLRHREARMQAAASRRASTRGKDRQLHMRVALWLQRTIATEGAWPTARRLHETFGVSLGSAYAFRADFEIAIRETQS